MPFELGLVVERPTTRPGSLGEVAIVSPVSKRDTARSMIKKAFKNELFIASPNPVKKGTALTVYFKIQGVYSIQLFDNNGKLYLQKRMTVEVVNQSFSLPIEESMANGIYYIKAIDEKTNRNYIEKILVQ